MSWSRCSKALVAIFVLLAAAAPVAAITSSSSGVPDEAQVGSEQTATYTLSELYADGSQEWTLAGRTNMTGVQWTVELRKLGGNVETESFSGQTFSVQVSADDDVERVVVTVRGTTPPVDNFSYEPPETFVFAQLNKTAGDAVSPIASDETHHYTDESTQARKAIEDAEAAIDEAGGDQEAERLLDNAISAYNQENFGNAADLAEQAEAEAQQKQQASSRTQLLVYAAIAVVALLVIGGGIYYWRSRQDSYDKLG